MNLRILTLDLDERLEIIAGGEMASDDHLSNGVLMTRAVRWKPTRSTSSNYRLEWVGSGWFTFFGRLSGSAVVVPGGLAGTFGCDAVVAFLALVAGVDGRGVPAGAGHRLGR